MAKAAKRNGQQQRSDDDDGGDDGELFSEDQRTEITNLVNAAVSGQLQRKLPKAISDGIATPMGELRTLIEGMSARGGRVDDGDDDQDDPPAPKAKGGKGGRRAAEPDPEKEDMRKRLAAIETERKQEREQNRNRERDTSLREHLTKLGVDPNRIRGAIAVLRESTKYDEKTGDWSYVAKRDGYDEEIDIATGAKEWAGTDEGKSYLAPTGGGARGGSGTRVNAGGSSGAGGGGAGGTGGRPVTDPKAAKAQAKQAAVAALGQAVNELGGGVIGIG